MKLSEVLELVDINDDIEIVDANMPIDSAEAYQGPALGCTDDKLLPLIVGGIAAIDDALLIIVERRIDK